MGDQQRRFRYFVIFTLVFFLVWGLRATVFYSIDLRFEAGLDRKVYSESVKILLWTIPVFLFLIFVDRTDPFQWLKLTTKPTLRSWIYPCAGFVAYFAVTIIFEYFVHGRRLDPNLNASGFLGTLAGVSITPVSEEIVFRGFILGKLSGVTSFPVANLITSILFVGIHQPNWLWVNGFQSWIPLVSGGIFILSLLLGWIVKSTNSLYPAIAGHIINNFIAAILRP